MSFLINWSLLSPDSTASTPCGDAGKSQCKALRRGGGGGTTRTEMDYHGLHRQKLAPLFLSYPWSLFHIIQPPPMCFPLLIMYSEEGNALHIAHFVWSTRSLLPLFPGSFEHAFPLLTCFLASTFSLIAILKKIVRMSALGLFWQVTFGTMSLSIRSLLDRQFIPSSLCREPCDMHAGGI